MFKNINWKNILTIAGVALVVVWIIAPKLKGTAQKLPLVGPQIA